MRTVRTLVGIVMVLLVMAAVSCRCPKPVTTSEKVHDIETITEIIRDTVVVIAPDSASIKALLECDENNRVVIRQLTEYQTGKHVQPPKVIIRDNILTATAKVDSMGIFLQLKDKYYSQQKTKTITETNTEYVKVRGLVWWIGLVCSIVILVFIGLKTYQVFKT